MEIKFTCLNMYDGLKALTKKKIAKDKFVTVGEFVERIDSEEGTKWNTKDKDNNFDEVNREESEKDP